MNFRMEDLLAEVRASLPGLVWSREKQDDPAAVELQAVFYRGVKDDLLVCATSFSIEAQGFPDRRREGEGRFMSLTLFVLGLNGRIIAQLDAGGQGELFEDPCGGSFTPERGPGTLEYT